LSEALARKAIRGAALDVLAEEPPRSNHPLTTLENCIITPYLGWSALEAHARVLRIAGENLGAYLAGRAQKVVNGPSSC